MQKKGNKTGPRAIRGEEFAVNYLHSAVADALKYVGYTIQQFALVCGSESC